MIEKKNLIERLFRSLQPQLLQEHLRLVKEYDLLSTRLDQMELICAKVAKLESIVEYSVIRDARLIEFNKDFYFYYTADNIQPVLFGLDILEATHQRVAEEVVNRTIRWNTAARNKPELPTLDRFLRVPPSPFTVLTPLILHMMRHEPQFQFIDIGANIGITAFPIARLIKDFGRQNTVISFEPGHVAELFDWNIKLNNMEDVVVAVPMAVSSFVGVAPIKAMARHSESVSLQDFTKHYPELYHAEIRMVPIVTLDKFVADQKISFPLFVKIDAEGEDCNVVEGMQNLINNNQVTAAVIEIAGKYMTENEFLKLASRFENYTIINMRTLDVAGIFGYHEIIDRNDLPNLFQSICNSPHGWTDLLFIKNSLADCSKFLQAVQNWKQCH